MHLKDTIAQSVFLIAILRTANIYGQRVAPGVPPQHYQQVPVQQYQQHPQQHQQQQQQQYHQQVAPGVAPQNYQPPGQYQQVPVQQQHQQQYQQQQVPQQQIPQQQVPQQQVPNQQPHQQQPPPHHQQQPHHGHQPHGQPQQVLNAGNMEHERAHIQEHMQVPIDTSKMSEAELQFHYFKMHDSDNNNKLDGCELIKSLIHWHVDKPQTTNGTGEKEGTIYTDQQLSDIIDYVLNSMDFNKDGYVEYSEYRRGEENAENEKRKEQEMKNKN